MKFIDDIRRDNLRNLENEFGSLGALANHLERSESQISQWINGSINSGNNKPRGMRASTARWIEAKCRRPDGWLDIDHSQAPAFDDADINGVVTIMLGLNSRGRTMVFAKVEEWAKEAALSDTNRATGTGP